MGLKAKSYERKYPFIPKFSDNHLDPEPTVIYVTLISSGALREMGRELRSSPRSIREFEKDVFLKNVIRVENYFDADEKAVTDPKEFYEKAQPPLVEEVLEYIRTGIGLTAEEKKISS